MWNILFFDLKFVCLSLLLFVFIFSTNFAHICTKNKNFQRTEFMCSLDKIGVAVVFLFGSLSRSLFYFHALNVLCVSVALIGLPMDRRRWFYFRLKEKFQIRMRFRLNFLASPFSFHLHFGFASLLYAAAHDLTETVAFSINFFYHHYCFVCAFFCFLFFFFYSWLIFFHMVWVRVPWRIDAISK